MKELVDPIAKYRGKINIRLTKNIINDETKGFFSYSLALFPL